VSNPLIIGPDSESEQWVAAVAKDAGGPYSVLEKVRRGDREVEIELRDLSLWRGRTPVLVDDIVSTGRTMIEAVRLLTDGWPSPICIAVHGLFADNSDLLLERTGARVVTTNSVPHRTNAIELRALLAGGVKEAESGA
jgi:ribose-phosphate pyrophosphokinase